MSHPIPDPNPPHVLLNRLRATTVAVQDHPEMYTTETLRAFLRASKRLAQVAGTELVRREMP